MLLKHSWGNIPITALFLFDCDAVFILAKQKGLQFKGIKWRKWTLIECNHHTNSFAYRMNMYWLDLA